MEKSSNIKSGGIGPISFSIKLARKADAATEEIEIKNAKATSDNALPESFWACFEVTQHLLDKLDSYQRVDAASPPKPMSSLECFDADQIAKDVASGNATAFQGEKYIVSERIVVVYDDGRGFAWDQRIN